MSLLPLLNCFGLLLRTVKQAAEFHFKGDCLSMAGEVTWGHQVLWDPVG